MDYDFFIAYATPNSSIAEELYAELAILGARCFLDTKTLRLGDDWDLMLPRAQAMSKATIVLVSNQCDQAFYQRDEIAAGVSLSRSTSGAHRVIPLYVDEPVTSSIPYGLRVKHGLYLTKDNTIRDVAFKLLQVVPELLHPSPLIPITSLSYSIDLCMCIDLSNSLQWLVSMMRRQLLTLGHDISFRASESGKAVTRLRVSIITFGSEEAPIRRTHMIELPADAAMLYEQALKLRLTGGGPFRSRGLEALEAAIESDWSTSSDKQRHVIALWTDRPTCDGVDLDRLLVKWNENMKGWAKRLIIFAPDLPQWPWISTHWESTLWFPVTEGGGLTELEYAEILDAIVRSV